MKKIIIPVIIAAVLGIGGGVAAVTLNIANNTTAAADVQVSNELLKSRTYYLNGDVNAEMWVEVNPDFLTLKGTDLDKSLTEAALRLHEEHERSLKEASISLEISADDETMALELEEFKQLYCAEKLYQLKYVGLETIPYTIKVDCDNTITDREELLRTNAGFPFNDKTNTISLAIGDFILVE